MSEYQFWDASFSDDVIRVVAGSFVEFSAKLSNSNANGGVTVKKYTDLPYLAVSTITPGAIESQNTTPANYAKAVKQILAVKAGRVDIYGMETHEILERIEFLEHAEINESGKLTPAKKAKIATLVRSEFHKTPVPDVEVRRVVDIIRKAANAKNNINIDQRMKQLLVFDPDLQTDVSITPLRSFGLPELIAEAESQRAADFGGLSLEDFNRLRFLESAPAKKALKEISEKSESEPKLYRKLFQRCDLPIGGANPQNIGIKKTSAIRSPLLIPLRSVSPGISKLFAIHYNGIDLVRYKLASELMKDFHKEKLAGFSFDSDFKKKMAAHARRIVADMNHRAYLALEQLRAASELVAGKNSDQCDDEDLFDASLLNDGIKTGVFIRKYRDNEWRKAFSERVITYLMSIKFKPDDESALIRSVFSDNEAAIIRSVIEEETI